MLQRDIEQLRIGQIQTLTDLFRMRIEVLFALVKPAQLAFLPAIQRNFLGIEHGLKDWADQLMPVSGENRYEAQLRMRGSNVIRRSLCVAIDHTREAVADLQEGLYHDAYTSHEWHTLRDTLVSLYTILDACEHLLEGGKSVVISN